ncbi:VPLPA-CTERM sorting domain-containing protein [Rhodobacterales bacterium HKCCE3408]|nr:VPLPA-CTERM sorting domain-containing protein [Rhodobacterales bacterium HKCCE3408]
MRLGLPVLAALFCAAFTGFASAATISLDVDRSPTMGANVYSNGTDSVAVSAVTLSGGSAIYTGSWAGNGVGACSGTVAGRTCRGDLAGIDGGWAVDGRGIAEMLTLDFGSQLVSITQLVFGKIEAGDDFILYTFGNGAGTAPTASTGLTSVFASFAPTPFASVFGVAAPGYDDEWKLRSVSFDVAPVPVPAAGLLLVGGLGALSLMRRRRQTA